MSTMTPIRQPAVAGRFYPGSNNELVATVDAYLSSARKVNGLAPKAIIAPHAGFIYSGSIAATAYARLAPVRDKIKRVILLGPCHRVAVKGMALPSSNAFATPLGYIPIDETLRSRALTFPQVEVFDRTHKDEHSLEVQLPFLQRAIKSFSLLPFVVGETSPESISEVLNHLWGGKETLIVVSSDLSHYLDYNRACKIDAETSSAIENLAPHLISREGACGRFPLAGLLVAAKARGMTVKTVDLRNSGDTAGKKDQVVGYGSWLFFENKDSSGERNKVEHQEGRKAISKGYPKETIATSRNKTDFGLTTKEFLKVHGSCLVRIATASIKYGFKHNLPAPVNLDQFPLEFSEPGATFITLTIGNNLRGCIGSLEPHRPLAFDISANAFRAGFKDPRFPPLSSDEYDGLHLSISLLSPQSPIDFLSEREFMEQLRPNIDGLVIADGRHRALFLPSVWRQLPTPSIFVERLKQKAGLEKNHWSESFQAWRFITVSISSDDL